jgi:hypothetical protein
MGSRQLLDGGVWTMQTHVIVSLLVVLLPLFVR